MEKLIEAYKTVNPNATLELQTTDSTTGVSGALDGTYTVSYTHLVGRAMLTGGDMAEICRTSLLQAMSLTHKWDEAIADEVNRKEDDVEMCIRDRPRGYRPAAVPPAQAPC